jgi:hypothetical protein
MGVHPRSVVSRLQLPYPALALAKAGTIQLESHFSRNLAPDLTHYICEPTKEDRNT